MWVPSRGGLRPVGFELAKACTFGCAHLALHALSLKLLLFHPLLAVGYVVFALLAVSDRSLLQILQLVLEGGQGPLGIDPGQKWSSRPRETQQQYRRWERLKDHSVLTRIP